ncbi:MAG: TIR domain-containing protein, partial [Gammaproteobacteria bacterium]|nr:TIR domain-containing protein [Gammaproteobacteria bacterium]
MAERPFPAYQGDGTYLFVSYAHADAEIIYPEMLWIRDQGFNLWYDDGIDVGSGWRQALADAITGAAGVIFFVTARSVVSDNCMREIGFALDENKSVFVVQLDDALLPSVLRLSLSDRQALVRSDFSEDAYHERLTDALRGKTDLSLAVSPQSEIRKQRTRMTASVVAALALGGAIYLAWSLLVRHPPTITLDNPTQITNAAGVEDYPAISPDGRTIAYHANGDGDWDIWVIQPGSADALNRTADFHGQDMYPTWSPDGRQIAFWSERDGGGYFVMQALAGAPRKVVSLEAEIGADYRYIPMSPPRWSSDGERLMYVRGAVSLGSYAEVIEIGSGKTTRVDMPGRVFGFDPVWSPDEQTISYVAGWHREYETNQIKAMRLADGHNT